MTAKTPVIKFPVLPWLIGITSILPFWFSAYVVYRPVAGFSQISAISLASIYGGVYLSLVGGTKWGLTSSGASVSRPSLQMFLGFLFALAGFAAIVLPAVIGLSILITGFMVAGLWDLIHSQSGAIAYWYTRLRIWLTILTVAPLLGLLLKVL